MIKIYVSVRNRLAISAKVLTAIKKHSTLPHQVYVYDNQTTYRTTEHFMYWSMLFKAGIISQVTFSSSESTFNAFSKASTFNSFLLQHSQDPRRDKCDFLVCMDNDIVLTPQWDIKIKKAWDDIKKLGMEKQIKIVGQTPGGIKNKTELKQKIGGMSAAVGKLGGSGFWTFLPNFYKDVGLLDLSKLVGHDKKHDQMYWQLLEKSSGGKDYILGLREKIAIHCGGKISGSVCNILTRNHLNKNKLNMINFEDLEKKIDDMSFDEFYNMISNDTELINGW